MTLPSNGKPLPLSAITVTDSFWSRWQELLLDVTLPSQFIELEKSGCLENFRLAARGASDGFKGMWFHDSDAYKFVEACAYALVRRSSTAVHEALETCIKFISEAQEDSGYLNTFFQIKHPTLKWRNLHSMHEMYCLGHLIEAAVALQENLRDDRLIQVAERFADHVMTIFGPGKRTGYCGHEELELALIRLSDVTQKPKYRDFAFWMIEQRGHKPSPFESEFVDPEAMSLLPGSKPDLDAEGNYDGSYYQDHLPIWEQTTVVGHAVRAMYLAIAATDLAKRNQDESLMASLDSLWKSLTTKRLYITGGLGPSRHNEGFTKDYDLPNRSAYAETCAACGLALWGRHMNEMTGNSEYIDVVERTLYNGMISGISLSGDRYFYDNPLESRGEHERATWFICACCPSNLARLIGSISQFFVSASADQIWVNIPAGCEIKATLNGVSTTLRIFSNYPWSGRVEIEVQPEKPVAFSLNLRIPDWADDVEIDLVDIEHEADFQDGYARFSRVWTAGERIVVDYNLQPQWQEANPLVIDNLGRLALTKGPIVYALESADLGCEPHRFAVDPEAELTTGTAKFDKFIPTLTAAGWTESNDFPDALYAPFGETSKTESTATFIPYFAWSNRGPGSMLVWVRQD